MDDSRLLQELNLTTRQPCRVPHHVIQAILSEGLAQCPYVAAIVRFEPATLRMQGTKRTTEPPRPVGRLWLGIAEVMSAILSWV